MIRLSRMLGLGWFAVMLVGCTGDTNSGADSGPPVQVRTSVLLPDTGQTTSYTEIFGEDSDYRINPQSYTKLDAGGRDLPDSAEDWTMVRDNVTGLVWEVKTKDGSIHDKDRTFSWRDARFAYMKELNAQTFGGFADWRLPYIRELSCLVNADRFCPALNTDYFPNTPSDFRTDFWSYDIYAWDVQRAWVVRFGWGGTFPADQSLLNHVRAVRGEAAWEQDDYVENGDGTVTDQYTGLMWQHGTAEEQMTWEEALTYCENLSLADYDDWRLPNRNELQSLVDKQPEPGSDIAINKAFPNTYPGMYWTSTHHAAPWWPANVWVVFFYTGGINPDWMDSSQCHVRAVRGGNAP